MSEVIAIGIGALIGSIIGNAIGTLILEKVKRMQRRKAFELFNKFAKENWQQGDYNMKFSYQEEETNEQS